MSKFLGGNCPNVGCPKCGAFPGDVCKTPYKNSGIMVDYRDSFGQNKFHAERLKLAKQEQSK